MVKAADDSDWTTEDAGATLRDSVEGFNPKTDLLLVCDDYVEKIKPEEDADARLEVLAKEYPDQHFYLMKVVRMAKAEVRKTVRVWSPD